MPAPNFVTNIPLFFLGEMKKSTRGITLKDIVDYTVGKKAFLSDSRDSLGSIDETVSSAINPMKSTSVTFSLKDKSEIGIAFPNSEVLDYWISGINYACSVSQLEKEDFYWYYCSMKEDSVRCSRGCNEMDESLFKAF